MICKGRLHADNKSAGPPSFGMMSHVRMSYGKTQKNKTDGQITLAWTEQHMGLEMNRPQAREQPQGQPSALVRGLIGNGLILWPAQRPVSVCDTKTEE